MHTYTYPQPMAFIKSVISDISKVHVIYKKKTPAVFQNFKKTANYE